MNNRNFNHSSNIYFGCELFSRDFIANVQKVNIPGISYNNVELNKSAVKFYKQGCTAVYNTLSVDVLVDENLFVWKEIMDRFQTMTKVGDGDMEMMEFNSFIHIFNEQDKSIMKLNFEDCIIQSIGDLNFQSDGNDEELTVTLSIDYAFYTLDPLHSKKKKIEYEEKSLLKQAILSENYDKFKDKE